MKYQKTRRLAAIMFTDIVGYTALMQQDENVATIKRTRHRQEFQQQHATYNGEIVQYFGDGTLSVFQSCVEAVECAIAIQKALKQGEIVPLRIGIHIGDVVFDGTDIFGDGVNLASRIEHMSVAGAILLSGKLNGELKNQQHISTKSLGYYELKNVEEPIEIFSVTNNGIKIPDRSELNGKQKVNTKSIAVLPFVNMSNSKDNEYFSDGMTEEIINALAKIKSLKVTSRTSSFHFKGKNVPIPQIAQALNVGIILEGSIRLSGNKMRITAQLINVIDDSHFWSETFDRSIENVFEVQDEISLLIADKLRENIGHFEIGDRLIESPEIPVEVYKKYLRGRFYVYKFNKPDTEKGIAILEEVILEAPNYPLSYIAIQMAYSFLGAIGFMNAVEAFKKGKPYLDKAIELEENLPECQYNLAGVAFWQGWDLDATYRHLNRALELRPGFADAYFTLSVALASEKKFEASLQYIERGIQLDPLSPMGHYILGLIYYYQNKYELAVANFEKSIRIDPDFIMSKIILGGAFLLMGRIEESMAFYQKLPDNLGDLSKLGGITLVHAAKGDIEKAEAGITQLEVAGQTDLMGRAMTFLIYIQTILGRHELALQLIEQAINLRIPVAPMFNPEPLIQPLHQYPRFHQMMKQVLGEGHFQDFPEKKYKSSSLKKSELEQYCQRLEAYMKKEQPYLQSDLSLRKLAKMIDMPPHNLSQMLNEKIGKNFSEYVNSYRIEAFKSKAKDTANHHLTILGLAYDSGFNSKTTFNTFFKKTMGKTPRQFWKEEIG